MSSTPDYALASLLDGVVFPDSDSTETYVTELPAGRVVEVLHMATEIRRRLYQLEKMAQSRIEAEQILSVGETWESPDGRSFMWAGDRHREVTDPEGLRAALIAMNLEGLSARALRATFKTEWKTYLTELDKIARFAPETESTIRDFTKWVEGPHKLRALDREETGR